MIVPKRVLNAIKPANAEDAEATSRLEMYTDAVFSIIATVMILPLMEYLKEEDVEFTVDLVENYIAFVLTYFLLGMLIRTHNQLFYRISKVTGTLALLNTLYLLALAGYPFVNGLISQYEMQNTLTVEQGGWVPWTAHALVTFAASIFQLMLVLYLYFTTGAQMKAGMKEHMLFVCTMYMIITLSGVFSVITISFFYPSEAMYGYLLVPIMFVIARFARRRFFPVLQHELDIKHEGESSAPEPNVFDHGGIYHSGENYDSLGHMVFQDGAVQWRNIQDELELPVSVVLDADEYEEVESISSAPLSPKSQKQADKLKRKEEKKRLKAERKAKKRAEKARKKELRKRMKALEQKSYAKFQKERLEAFSDGIFAISVTLVAVNMRPPEIDLDDESDVHLAEAVLDMWQQYYSYVAGEQQYPAHTLSVAVVVELHPCTVLPLTREQVISVLWYIHHEVCKVVHDVNDLLWWLNFLFLMFVSSLPFFAELMTTSLTSDVDSVYFIGSLSLGVMALGGSLLGVWLYVLRHRDKHARDAVLFTSRMITVMTATIAAIPLGAVLSFFVSLFFDVYNILWVVWVVPMAPVAILGLFGMPWSYLLESHDEEGTNLNQALKVDDGDDDDDDDDYDTLSSTASEPRETPNEYEPYQG